MARGKKTSPELIYKIMAEWAVTDSFSETARKLEVPITTVKDVVETNKEKPEFVKLRNKIKKNFSETASRIIEKAMMRLEKAIEDDEKDIPINHLSTVIGTMYDKKALADGQSTENVAVEIKLPEGIDEYAG